jgi:hypothetical protein
MTLASNAVAWLRSPWRWLAIAATGAALCAAIYALQPAVVVQSCWLALLAWTGLSVGALGVLALYGLVGGRWGQLLGPALVAATQPLSLMAALFIPLLFHLPVLFPWAREEHTEAAIHLHPALSYYTVPWFPIRSAGYWGLWLLLAIVLPARGLGQPADAHGGRPSPRMSAAAFPLVVLTVTFSSIDWMMSLEPHWYSPTYGVLILAGQGAAAFAFAIIVAAIALGDRTAIDGRDFDPASHNLSGSPWHDAGNLLLAAICFWMYIAFSQFLIVWSGNLPEEIPWYLTRARQPWRSVAATLVVLHFAIPFACLLSRDLKRSPRALSLVAGLVLAMHAVDLWWLIAPALGPASLVRAGCGALALVTVGSLWMFAFALRPPQWQEHMERKTPEIQHPGT